MFHLVSGQWAATQTTQADTVEGRWQVVWNLGGQPWKPSGHTAWKPGKRIVLWPGDEDLRVRPRSPDVQAHTKLLQVFLHKNFQANLKIYIYIYCILKITIQPASMSDWSYSTEYEVNNLKMSFFKPFFLTLTDTRNSSQIFDIGSILL